MKRKPKNHKVYRQLWTFEDLLPVLYSRKSIYFDPAGKVLPTKFFMGWSWMSGAVKNYLEAGAFYEVESYERITRDRIKKALADCPPTIRMSDEPAATIRDWSEMGLFRNWGGIQYTDKEIFNMQPFVNHIP